MNATPLKQPSECSTEPFAVNRKELTRLFASPQLAQDLVDVGWIEVVRAGKPGRETLFDFQSAKAAYARLRGGESPVIQGEENNQAN